MLTKPDSEDIYSLKKLWKNTFGDTDSYIELFFKYKFDCGKCFIFKENDSIISALYYFDIFLTDGTERYKAAYICGIATVPEKRGKGIAGRLIETCIQELRDKEYDLALLIPASTGLFDYYRRFGFQEFSYISNWSTDTLHTSDNSDTYLICDRTSNDLELLELCYGSPVNCNGISYYKTDKNEYTALEYTEIPCKTNGRIIRTAYNHQCENSRPFTSAIILRSIKLPEKKYINLLLN